MSLNMMTQNAAFGKLMAIFLFIEFCWVKGQGQGLNDLEVSHGPWIWISDSLAIPLQYRSQFQLNSTLFFSKDVKQVVIFCLISSISNGSSSLYFVDFDSKRSSNLSSSSSSSKISNFANPKFSWIRNGVEIDTLNENVPENQLTLKTDSPDFENDYSCKFEAPELGVLTSPTVAIKFAGFKLPRKDRKPRKHIGFLNHSIFVPCIAPKVVPHFAQKTWFIKDGHVMYNDSSSSHFITSNGLHLSSVNWQSTGNYVCMAQNLISGQIVESKPVQVLIENEERQNVPIQILTPNRRQIHLDVVSGENVTLECLTYGVPRLETFWEKYDHSPLDFRRTLRIFDNIIIQNVSKFDEGSYICKSKVSSIIANDEKYSKLPFVVYSLKVYEPMKAKIDVKLLPNTSKLALTCLSSGGPVSDMVVLYNGQSLLNNLHTKPISVNINGDHENPKWTLLFESRYFSPGFYQCIIYNKVLSWSYIDTVFVSLTKEENRDQFDNIKNPGKVRQVTESKMTTPFILAVTIGEEPADSGVRDDEEDIDNGDRSADNYDSRLIDNSDFSTPKIIDKPENSSTFVGSSVTFVCRAKNSEQIFWLKNHKPMPMDPRFDLLGYGNLEIRQVVVDDQAQYTCVSKSHIGNDSSSAWLTVYDNNQPSNNRRQTFQSENDQRDDKTTFENDFDDSKSNLHNQRHDSDNFFHAGEIESDNLSINVHDQNLEFSSLKNNDASAFRENSDLETHEDVTVERRKERIRKIRKSLIGTPTIHRLSNHSILLKWNVSNNLPKKFSSDLESFRIQYKKIRNNNQRQNFWITVDGVLSKETRSFVVENLEPGRKYKFRIGGLFDDGRQLLSKSSRKFLLETRLKILPIDQSPVLIEVSALSSSDLFVKWQMPLLKPDVEIDGFIVNHRRIYRNGQSSPTIFQNHTVLGNSTQNFTLQHLLPASPYEIKIFAFNGVGSGPASNSVIQSTLTLDGSLSPLSFLSLDVEEKYSTKPTSIVQLSGDHGHNHFIENQYGDATRFKGRKEIQNDSNVELNIFGLKHETFLIIAGSLFALIIILVIISSISWKVTQKLCRKRTTFCDGHFFDDTSKRIYDEQSLKKIPKQNKDEGDFYSFSSPEYDATCEFDVVKHHRPDGSLICNLNKNQPSSVTTMTVLHNGHNGHRQYRKNAQNYDYGRRGTLPCNFKTTNCSSVENEALLTNGTVDYCRHEPITQCSTLKYFDYNNGQRNGRAPSVASFRSDFVSHYACPSSRRPFEPTQNHDHSIDCRQRRNSTNKFSTLNPYSSCYNNNNNNNKPRFATCNRTTKSRKISATTDYYCNLMIPENSLNGGEKSATVAAKNKISRPPTRQSQTSNYVNDTATKLVTSSLILNSANFQSIDNEQQLVESHRHDVPPNCSQQEPGGANCLTTSSFGKPLLNGAFSAANSSVHSSPRSLANVDRRPFFNSIANQTDASLFNNTNSTPSSNHRLCLGGANSLASHSSRSSYSTNCDNSGSVNFFNMPPTAGDHCQQSPSGFSTFLSTTNRIKDANLTPPIAVDQSTTTTTTTTTAVNVVDQGLLVQPLVDSPSLVSIETPPIVNGLAPPLSNGLPLSSPLFGTLFNTLTSFKGPASNVNGAITADAAFYNTDSLMFKNARNDAVKYRKDHEMPNSDFSTSVA